MGARPGGWTSAVPQASPLIRGSIRFRVLVNELLQAGVMDWVRDVRAGPDQGGVRRIGYAFTLAWISSPRYGRRRLVSALLSPFR